MVQSLCPLAPKHQLSLPFNLLSRDGSPILPAPSAHQQILYLTTTFLVDPFFPILPCSFQVPSLNQEHLIPHFRLYFRELDLRQRGFLKIPSKLVGCEWKEYSFLFIWFLELAKEKVLFFCFCLQCYLCGENGIIFLTFFSSEPLQRKFSFQLQYTYRQYNI